MSSPNTTSRGSGHSSSALSSAYFRTRPVDGLIAAWPDHLSAKGLVFDHLSRNYQRSPLVKELTEKFPSLGRNLTVIGAGKGPTNIGRVTLLVVSRGLRGEYLLPVYAPHFDREPLDSNRLETPRHVEAFSHAVGIVIDGFENGRGQPSIDGLFTARSFANAQRHLHQVRAAFSEKGLQYTSRSGDLSNVAVPSHLFQLALSTLQSELYTGSLAPDHDQLRIIGINNFSLKDRTGSAAIIDLIVDKPGGANQGERPLLLSVDVRFCFNRLYGSVTVESAFRSLAPH